MEAAEASFESLLADVELLVQAQQRGLNERVAHVQEQLVMLRVKASEDAVAIESKLAELRVSARARDAARLVAQATLQGSLEELELSCKAQTLIACSSAEPSPSSLIPSTRTIGTTAHELTSVLQRETASYLNTITPENFESIKDKFCRMRVDSAADLALVVKLIFDKALADPAFGDVYADLCVSCATQFPEFARENEPSKPITLKRLLLNRCQKEFSLDKNVDVSWLDPCDAATAVSGAKTRSLGNIRFIGELFKAGMLNEKIMHECVLKLLYGDGINTQPREDDIECLCELLLRIGKQLDNKHARTHLNAYFATMAHLAEPKTNGLSVRHRVMLHDVIELRKMGW